VPCRCAAIAFLAVIPTFSRAGTYRVPEDFATIQPAIDACAVGDTVLVGPGTYIGSDNTLLDFHGVDLVLKSSHGSGQTVVDGEGKARGINLESGETLASRIEGFTVQNCYYNGETGPGGGMRCAHASATLDDMVFLNNKDDSTGGGVDLAFGELLITRSRFEGNIGRIDGGGLCVTAGAATLTDVSFIDNLANWGGGIHLEAVPPDGLASLSLERVAFAANRAVHNGGGLDANLWHSSITIRDCTFTENTTDEGDGGGAKLYNYATGSIEHTLFQGNWADREGGGLSIQDHSSITLNHVDFIGNGAYSGCGGLNIYFYCQPVLTQCTFQANSTLSDHAGGVYVASTSITMDRCIVAFSTGAGFYGSGPTTLNLTCCDVFGNSGGDYTGTVSDQTGVNGTFSADPQFCGIPDSGNFLLQSDSPCAPGQHDCEAYIGSKPVGCGAVATTRSSMSAIKARY